MESKEVYKAKIENQLARWKNTIDGLKIKLDQAEVDAKAKFHEQLDGLHDKRARAEKLLEELSATSHDAWEQVKSSVDQGWTDLTRSAKNTMAKVRDAMAKPSHDEEIRQIAYHLWLDEGCPHGRHQEHWLRAEEIWRERQAANPAPDKPRATRARKTAVAPRAKKSTGKAKPRRRPQPPASGGSEKP